MDRMTHLFTITLDHYRQFRDAFRLSFSTIKAIQPVNYREHPDHKINTDIHPAIITELVNKQYHQIDVEIPGEREREHRLRCNGVIAVP